MNLLYKQFTEKELNEALNAGWTTQLLTGTTNRFLLTAPEHFTCYRWGAYFEDILIGKNTYLVPSYAFERNVRLIGNRN